MRRAPRDRPAAAALLTHPFVAAAAAAPPEARARGAAAEHGNLFKQLARAGGGELAIPRVAQQLGVPVADARAAWKRAGGRG
jgi:hypothetical protein